MVRFLTNPCNVHIEFLAMTFSSKYAINIVMRKVSISAQPICQKINHSHIIRRIYQHVCTQHTRKCVCYLESSNFPNSLPFPFLQSGQTLANEKQYTKQKSSFIYHFQYNTILIFIGAIILPKLLCMLSTTFVVFSCGIIFYLPFPFVVHFQMQVFILNKY